MSNFSVEHCSTCPVASYINNAFPRNEVFPEKDEREAAWRVAVGLSQLFTVALKDSDGLTNDRVDYFRDRQLDFWLTTDRSRRIFRVALYHPEIADPVRVCAKRLLDECVAYAAEEGLKFQPQLE